MRVAAVSLTARPAPVAQAMRQLKYAGALCVVFMILEVIGGSIDNSLAIMTDAAHLLSDLLAFAVKHRGALIAQLVTMARIRSGQGEPAPGRGGHSSPAAALPL